MFFSQQCLTKIIITYGKIMNFNFSYLTTIQAPLNPNVSWTDSRPFPETNQLWEPVCKNNVKMSAQFLYRVYVHILLIDKGIYKAKMGCLSSCTIVFKCVLSFWRPPHFIAKNYPLLFLFSRYLNFKKLWIMIIKLTLKHSNVERKVLKYG